MDEIKEGAIVALASDGVYGPQLTVGKITNGKAECLWFEGKKLRRAHIPIAGLKYLRE